MMLSMISMLIIEFGEFKTHRVSSAPFCPPPVLNAFATAFVLCSFASLYGVFAGGWQGGTAFVPPARSGSGSGSGFCSRSAASAESVPMFVVDQDDWSPTIRPAFLAYRW